MDGIQRFLQGQVASHHHQPKIYINARVAMGTLAMGAIFFFAFSIVTFVLLEPPAVQNVHIGYYSPEDAVKERATCKQLTDLTDYGEHGLLIAQTFFGRLYLRTPLTASDIEQQIENITTSWSCQHYVPTDVKLSYGNYMGQVFREESFQVNAQYACTPTDVDPHSADMYFVPSMSWEENCEALLASYKEMFWTAKHHKVDTSFWQTLHDMPDIWGMTCDMNHRESKMTFIYHYIWHYKDGRGIVSDLNEVNYASGQPNLTVQQFFVYCLSDTFGYGVARECNGTNVDYVPVAPSRKGMGILRYMQEEINFTGHLLDDQWEWWEALIPGRKSTTPLDAAARQAVNKSLEQYSAAKLFRFSCTSYDDPGFQSHASYCWPVLSIALSMTLLGIRAVYRFIITACEWSGHKMEAACFDVEASIRELHAENGEIQATVKELRDQIQTLFAKLESSGSPEQPASGNATSTSI